MPAAGVPGSIFLHVSALLIQSALAACMGLRGNMMTIIGIKLSPSKFLQYSRPLVNPLVALTTTDSTHFPSKRQHHRTIFIDAIGLHLHTCGAAPGDYS